MDIPGIDQNGWDAKLPEEIWRIIFGSVENSKDLLNASFASPIFHDILHPKKSTWMFEQILPHIFKDLRKPDLMNLRLVCKSWCSAVDDHVASHPSLLAFNEHSYKTVQSSFNYLPLSTKVYDDVAFVNGENFSEFLKAFEGHPRNPFFGRAIRIGSCGDLFEHIDDVVLDTWNGAEQLCKQFGFHIWHVEFANYEYSLSSLEFYKGVNQSLQNLPNLKTLHMNGALDFCQVDDNQLSEYMENHPLPQLPHLEVLVFDLVMEAELTENDMLGLPRRNNRSRNASQDSDDIVEYLEHHPEVFQLLLNKVPQTPNKLYDKFVATYGGQLKKLEIDMSSWKEGYAALLTSLTELHLKQVNSIPKLKSILNNLQVGQGLGKLMISLRCSMKTTELFEILEPLRILHLDFGYVGEAPDDYLIEESSDDVLPAISSLLLLRIKDTVNMTYEFLKSLPSLEHLDVYECQHVRKQFQQEYDEDEEEGSDITDELRKLIYKEDDEDGESSSEEEEDNKGKSTSNIWNLLPSLKIITYRTRSGVPSLIKRFARDSHSWEYICSY